MEVDEWLAEVRASGIKSIICLLSDDQLLLYGHLPTDLITYYRNAGFNAEHVPAQDYRLSNPMVVKLMKIDAIPLNGMESGKTYTRFGLGRAIDWPR